MARSYIIIVNWNGHLDTIECLESLLRLDDQDCAIVVVDNGSTDGSVEALRSWWEKGTGKPFDNSIWSQLPTARVAASSMQAINLESIAGQASPQAKITFVSSDKNLGFAGANNVGMRFAANDPEAKYFWILNNDTVVTPASLGMLVQHVEANPSDGLTGSVLRYYYSPGVIQGLGGWIKPKRALAGHIGSGLPVSSTPTASEIKKDLSYVMGASMFVKKEVYDTIGGMSEDYFLYFEELDWARRLPSKYKLGICLNSIIFHKEGKSIGSSSVKRPSNTSLYYLYVNSLRFYWRYERIWTALVAARITWDFFIFAKKRDVAALRVIVHVFGDTLTNRRRRGLYNSPEFRFKSSW